MEFQYVGPGFYIVSEKLAINNISHLVWYPNYLLYDRVFTLRNRKPYTLHMASYKRKVGSIPETEQKILFWFEIQRSVESTSNRKGDQTENEHVEKRHSDYVVRLFSKVTEFE